jgi:hypothetical protein
MSSGWPARPSGVMRIHAPQPHQSDTAPIALVFSLPPDTVTLSARDPHGQRSGSQINGVLPRRLAVKPLRSSSRACSHSRQSTATRQRAARTVRGAPLVNVEPRKLAGPREQSLRAVLVSVDKCGPPGPQAVSVTVLLRLSLQVNDPVAADLSLPQTVPPS